MGTICERPHKGTIAYQARVRIKGFPRRSRTFLTRAEAEAWATTHEARIRQRIAAAQAAEDQKHIAENCAPQYRLFGDLMRRYLAEVTPQKRSANEEALRMRGLLKHSLAECTLLGLTSKRVAQWRDERLTKVSGSTVCRDMNLLGHVVEIARREWEIEFELNPFRQVRRPPQGLARERRLSRAEEKRLLDACVDSKSPYMRPSIILAIETAMRRSEIVELEWERVNLAVPSVQLTRTKNGKPRGIPLSRRAVATLSALLPDPSNSAEQRGAVFPGLTTNALKLTFRRAINRAKITDLRFHDLRHEATSRLFEKGLSTMEVASITGHEDVRMLRRYTHLHVGDLAKKLD
ncbi:site-specific integrase [Paraburkholderia sp. CNPSo 3274]|uniref:site-specific integrase n=1 Tax=Paraburkholderia sp. CNPSo 3274 TaxID=2940932 RepID=UPI0020B6C8FB|nr:site-specific integrase [Paraburkholderia sp. CNPSo 3274]MCP3712992.1 site-specific integrase [Paraburkholderia sp. CNPSo 3274]